MPEPELDPEPMPLEPGVLGAVVLLPLVPLPDDMPLDELPEAPVLPLDDVPPLVAPVEEPLAPKCLSHSWRDTCPSLLVSTDEKLGWPAAPLEAPPELEPVALGDDEEAPDVLLGEDDDPPEALLGLEDEEPEALGVDDEAPEALLGDDDLSLALGLELLLPLLMPLDEEPELELCAIETLASAKSAAAVAVLTTFRTIVTSS